MSLVSVAALAVEDLPDYPVDADARLDHRFLMWESARWMNSEMRWNASAEAKCYWFELVNVAYAQTPVGTLPRDVAMLSRMVQPHISEMLFRRLCDAPFGPLHGWVPCRCGDQVRLMHPVLTRIVVGAFSSRANFMAASEAASSAKRLKRLTADLAEIAPKIAQDPRKVRFADDVIRAAIEARGGERRLPSDLHHAVQSVHRAILEGRFADQQPG